MVRGSTQVSQVVTFVFFWSSHGKWRFGGWNPRFAAMLPLPDYFGCCLSFVLLQ